MWMIKPSIVREVTIDLPTVLVESLGVGAEILARFLTTLAEEGVTDHKSYPRPPPVLCRICERHITSWWFEKHTELCLQEHTAERDVQFAQENLSDHRKSIVKVLDALEAQNRPTRSTSTEAAPTMPVAEYNGFTIGSNLTPPSSLGSGRSSPASNTSRSRERPPSGFGHHRARSFAVRRPIPRIVELLLDLCDTALEITMPAVKEIPGQAEGEIRTQSPDSESKLSQVLQWQSPSTGTVEQEQGLAQLCEDTSKIAKGKVDAVQRYRGILEYSERIRIEFDVLVNECIEAAVAKAAKIAAGELTDSSEDQIDDIEDVEDDEIVQSPDPLPADESIFPCSLETPSAMSEALRNSNRKSIILPSERPPSSTAASTRSNSPRGARTPRSHMSMSGMISLSKRASMHLESDAGADSDSSVPSYATKSGLARADSVRAESVRAESPISELSLSRANTTRERKRHSLILPSSKPSRQHSPARSMPPPSSPLRMAKQRVGSGTEGSQSPVTSPVLLSNEFSSPAVPPHMAQLHRRQSSTNSSEAIRSTSPRPAPVSSNPQPRATAPSIKDFEVIKPISKGAFGSVFLAKKKSTNEYFAIKVLKKADMVAKNQVTNVKAERAIMMWQGESDFVAKLYWTFANKDYLFLVMEYLNGGDCASLIKSLSGLSEDWSKRYLAEVVLGVEHLHSRGIVHRDLKPDNLLIDSKGHLKLTDFGLSRMGIVGRQKRAVQTSPEETPVPDLLKQGPFQRAPSVGSSRSASFDFQGGSSPSQTPSMTPAVLDLAQPSYFSLSREPSRRLSGTRSDSENSEALNAMFRRFSLVDDAILAAHNQSPIEEESSSQAVESPESYALHSALSTASGTISSPLTQSGIVAANLALFDPEDSGRRFVGTPDYLAPETINGVGQDELSDWWSLGCILFEFLYGYPPFNADTPDQVFQNILARNIQWPDPEIDEVSLEAKDLMNKLMCIDPQVRLGANKEGNFATGAEEIRAHPWLADINWESLRDDEASFVPAPENPEDTEYFDARGATLQNFHQFEEQETSPVATPSGDYADRPHDALSRVRSQVNSMKRGLIPLHIPPHVRDGRSRRLSEPVAVDDFGNFTYKNLPVLEKANKDVIQKLKAEAMQSQNKSGAGGSSPVVGSPSPSLDSSPVISAPLKRTLSTNKGTNRPSSPLLYTNQPTCSPNRVSQPSSPLLVQFSTGQNHERRKTSSSSSSLSLQTSGSLQPGSFFEAPRLPVSIKTGSNASSPIKLAKSPGAPLTVQERSASAQRHFPGSSSISPRGRSLTVSSQESEDVIRELKPEHKRRSQVLDISPSSSDNEDTRQKALLRVQRRRQSSRRLSQITLSEGPMYRPLDVLVCEDHPVSRLVMEKLLERLRCRTVTAQSGTEASRYAMGEVKFDIIFTESRLPQLSGSDFARMVRKTKNVNSTTPIVAVTGYLKELPPSHFFDGLIEKPPTIQKLTEVIGRLCQWKPPPPVPAPGAIAVAPTMPWAIPSNALSQLRYGALLHHDDSPTSFSSGFGGTIPSGSYRGSSREDSIGSSFFGDADNRSAGAQGDDGVAVKHVSSDAGDWQERDLVRNFEGLGISSGHDDGLNVGEVKNVTQSQPYPGTLEQITAALPTDFSKLNLPPPANVPLSSVPGEWIALKKKRSAEQQQHYQQQVASRASGESGDDEDDELGLTMRTRSPRNRPRGTSKLGTEMMRTNSRGSVVSVEGGTEWPPTGATARLEPIVLTEPPVVEESLISPHSLTLDTVLPTTSATTTPPRETSGSALPGLEPPLAVEGTPEEEDLYATPRPVTMSPPGKGTPDPDPTPRPSVSPSRQAVEKEGEQEQKIISEHQQPLSEAVNS
jgi:serine/threonine-protein kinase RIM15